MKKHLLTLACACLAFAACDGLFPGDNNETPGLDELPEIGGNEPTKELAPDEQQAKLQSVGEKMLAEFPAEAFSNLAAIAEAFDQTYGYNEDYDLSALEEWAENSESVAYSHSYQDSYENNGVGFRRTNLLLLLSNHTGLFTFGANKVTVAPYNSTKAVFTVDGKTYEAEITSSGKVTTAYFEFAYHNEWASGDSNGDGLVNDDDKHVWDRVTKVTIGVPESINVSITENGTPLATVQAIFSLAVTPEEFQFSTDAFAVEYTTVINGYELKVSKTGYDGPASKAQMMTTLSNGGKTLITYVASADLHLKTDVITGSYTSGNESSEQYDNYTSKEVVVEKFENFKVAMDILGEIQVAGTCSDVNKLNTEIDAVYEALSKGDEATATRYAENVNGLIDFGVYYDNGNNKQADIEFEYYYETNEWTDGEYTYATTSWGFDPVIVFTNGNRNKIEDFFTEDAFGRLFESLDEFADSYNTVFGYFLEVEEDLVPDYNN